MKKADCKEIIRETANNYGFEFEDCYGQQCIRDGWYWEKAIVNFKIAENPTWNMADNEIVIDFEFSASIAQMGGNPSVEDLLKASDTIKRAAQLVEALNNKKLQYKLAIEEK